jgi:hypothetical protein
MGTNRAHRDVLIDGMNGIAAASVKTLVEPTRVSDLAALALAVADFISLSTHRTPEARTCGLPVNACDRAIREFSIDYGGYTVYGRLSRIGRSCRQGGPQVTPKERLGSPR